MLKLIVIVLIFLAGFIFITNNKSSDLKEAFDTIERDKPSCPNILIKDGNQFVLKNTKLAEIPGVNPITFKSLEEYSEFLEWQRSQGITCPVLYFEREHSTQGEASFRMRPNPDPRQPQPAVPIDTPEDVMAGEVSGQVMPVAYNTQLKMKLMDASRNDPPYNNDQYPGYDADNQYIGSETPLDKMFHSGEDYPLSPNAMDTNWGGVDFSEQTVQHNYHGHHHAIDHGFHGNN